MRRWALLLFFLIHTFCKYESLPSGFDRIHDHVPDLIIALRYASPQNFMGRIVTGYEQPKMVLTTPTLLALKRAQDEFKQRGYGLKLFDGYRPQRAVDHFVRWATVLDDTLNKSRYYPHLSKDKLFELGYIAARSGHSRGSTIDVTLVFTEGKNTGMEVDMGSTWDFFGHESNFYFEDLTAQQQYHRTLLREVMMRHGFKPYNKEWWHFTLKDEPFPLDYFDF